MKPRSYKWLLPDYRELDDWNDPRQSEVYKDWQTKYKPREDEINPPYLEMQECVWEAKMMGKYSPCEGESIEEAYNRLPNDFKVDPLADHYFEELEPYKPSHSPLWFFVGCIVSGVVLFIMLFGIFTGA